MVIKIQDLKKGDEFIISTLGNFRYYKALEEPKLLAPKPQNPGRATRYGGVKCSTKMNITTYQHNWMQSPGTQKNYECTPFEHNHTERVNLNWRSMWLVRREEI